MRSFLQLSLFFLIGCRARRLATAGASNNHFTNCIPGGFQVPSPGGRMDGGSVFGQ
jgi:hypothetical protein